MPKRKRVLEQLEVAPPPPPRVPTEAELKAQADEDQRMLEYVKWKLGPILNEIKKRYKRFQRSLYVSRRGQPCCRPMRNADTRTLLSVGLEEG